MLERPKVYLEKTGIQQSYADALLNFHDFITGITNYTVDRMGNIGIQNIVPRTYENQISFLGFLHHFTEQIIHDLSFFGVSEDELQECLCQFQLVEKLKSGEPLALSFATIENGVEISNSELLSQANSRLNEMKMKIYETVYEEVGNYKATRKNNWENAGLFDQANMHDLNHVIATLQYDGSVLEKDLNELKRMSAVMGAISKWSRSLANSHPSLYSIAAELSAAISLEWSRYIRQLMTTDNEKVRSTLSEALSIFDSILGEEENEQIPLLSFLESQIPYLISAGHRHDQQKVIEIQVDDRRSPEEKRYFPNILANRGKLITVLRNLVEDAVLHGNYKDEKVLISISIQPRDENGVIRLEVSNPVWSSEGTMRILCEALGSKRILLDGAGDPFTVDVEDEGYGFHGLGKISVSNTVAHTLARAGVDPKLDRYSNIWKSRPGDDCLVIEGSERSAKRWFHLVCTLPLPMLPARSK